MTSTRKFRGNSLARRVMEMTDAGISPTEIARRLDCHKNNIYMTIRRCRLPTRAMSIVPLPEAEQAWLNQEAELRGMKPAEYARQMLLAVIPKAEART